MYACSTSWDIGILYYIDSAIVTTKPVVVVICLMKNVYTHITYSIYICTYVYIYISTVMYTYLQFSVYTVYLQLQCQTSDYRMKFTRSNFNCCIGQHKVGFERSSVTWHQSCI